MKIPKTSRREELAKKLGKPAASTPLLSELQKLTAASPGHIIAVRLGDFYEFFYEHATAIAETLSITLTRRSDVLMAGFPVFGADKFFRVLINKGYKVAISDYTDKTREIVASFETEEQIHKYFYEH